MAINVREKTIEEMQARLDKMNTELNKINYLESALRETGFSYEVKRFIWKNLAEFYDKQKMFDKAGKVMSNKAGVEITIKEKIESYLSAAEFYARAGKVEDADEMFFRALRDANGEQKTKIKLARKNIYLVSARSLESLGKKASAIKFYEKLIKTNLEEIEKKEIKEKLLSTYRSLGMFRESRLLEGA